MCIDVRRALCNSVVPLGPVPIASNLNHVVHMTQLALYQVWGGANTDVSSPWDAPERPNARIQLQQVCELHPHPLWRHDDYLPMLG